MEKSKPHYFFKVFFPDQSANCLRIPPAFWGNIEVGSRKKAYLKGQSGSIWKVNLVKKSDGLIFEDGWKEFVADQSLVMGDFLLFRYNGNSRFEVFVFDSTACEKKKAFIARPSVGEEIESVEGSEKSKEKVSVGEDDDDENKPLVHFARRIFDGSLKRMRGINGVVHVDQSNLKRSKSISSSKKFCPSFNSRAVTTLEETKSGSDHKTAHTSTNSTDLLTPKLEYEPYSPSCRDTPMQKNGESTDRNSAFSTQCSTINKMTKLKYQSGQVSRRSPHSTKKSTSEKSSKSQELAKSDESACRRGSIFRVGSLISQRRPVTEEEVERTLQRAMSFKSENPFAIAIMQDSYVYTSFFMCVPSWFAKEHLPKENTVLTIWDPAGNPWKITYICYNTHGALSGGWAKFSYAHNLEKYDVCLFELIKADNLKVHIYRVVEEITPLIRRRRGDNN